MGRNAYLLSPAALEELRRYLETGTRRHAVAGAPTTPSFRDAAEHLFAANLTAEIVNPGVLWRACRRQGIAVPGRAARTGKRRLKGSPPILEMQIQVAGGAA